MRPNHPIRNIFCSALVLCFFLFTQSAYPETALLPEEDEPSAGYYGYYMTDEPVFQFSEEKTGSRRIRRTVPDDPLSDIAWNTGMAGVSDIQTAFNSARQTENSQLGTSLPDLILPSQSEWSAMTDGEKALWLINRERTDRGIHPLHGLEENVTSVAQYYAQYLIDNNTWGHYEDGRDPWQRLADNPAIGACQDFLNVAENLAVFWTSGSSIPLPIERSIFNWMYDDGVCCAWGHRHAILWYPYNDNGGTVGTEGFLGIGRASGPHNGWNFAEMIVMNVFDPCATWPYDPLPPQVPTVSTAALYSITQTDAVSGGNISSDGGAAVSGRGVCWSTAPHPTVSDSKTSDGAGSGTFTSSVSGLTAGTRYYLRAYAVNSAGTAYGNEVSFTTSPVIELTLEVLPAGSGTLTPAAGVYSCSDGEVIQIEAFPEAGFRFSRWTGDVADTQSAATTVTMDTSKTVTAVFISDSTWNLDIDGNGSIQANKDGFLLMRYLYNVRGENLIAGAIGTGSARITAPEIEAYIALGIADQIVDIDSNGSIQANKDGFLVMRYFYNVRGENLIAGSVGSGAVRTAAAEIEDYIFSLYP